MRKAEGQLRARPGPGHLGKEAEDQLGNFTLTSTEILRARWEKLRVDRGDLFVSIDLGTGHLFPPPCHAANGN